MLWLVDMAGHLLMAGGFGWWICSWLVDNGWTYAHGCQIWLVDMLMSSRYGWTYAHG
jgi:hypothetical protein